MNPRDWFVLGIRLFGILLITRGTSYVAAFADLKLGLNRIATQVNPTSHLLYAAFEFALAAYFLFGARHLAAMCVGDASGEAKEAESV